MLSWRDGLEACWRSQLVSDRGGVVVLLGLALVDEVRLLASLSSRSCRHQRNRPVHCVERIVSARYICSTHWITSDYYTRHPHVPEVDSSLRVERECGRNYRREVSGRIEHIDDDRLSRSLRLDRRECIWNRVSANDRPEACRVER